MRDETNPIVASLIVERHYDLRRDDLWPDNDAPEEITAEVVADLMRQERTVGNLLRNWNLDDLDVIAVCRGGEDIAYAFRRGRITEAAVVSRD